MPSLTFPLRCKEVEFLLEAHDQDTGLLRQRPAEAHRDRFEGRGATSPTVAGPEVGGSGEACSQSYSSGDLRGIYSCQYSATKS